MALGGFKDFTAETASSADVDSYLMQGILVFATEAARDSALTGYLEEGRFAYTEDNDSLWLYDGSEWQPWFTQWTTYTPTWTNLTVGDGTQDADYRYIGGDLRVRGLLTFGSTTAVTGNISQNLPNSETADATGASGSGVAADDPRRYPLVVDCLPSDSTFVFYHAESTNDGVVNATAPFTWASGDKLRWDIFLPTA